MQELVQSVTMTGFPKSGLSSLIRTKNVSDDRDLERDGWWRTISATFAMIRSSNHLLENAQKTIAEQQERIALLEKQVTLDELTGLLNRRGFFDTFDREIDRTNRGHSQGGLLVLIDLDNFKMINDTYGHQAGDAALKLVAKTLIAESRRMDACARLGGDEFIVLLANADRDAVLTRAQTLIKRLNSLSLVWYGAEIPIRASLGLEDYTAGDTVDEIFGQADSKLYDHKRANKGSAYAPLQSSF